MKLKRESVRDSQTFEEVVDHVNEISSVKRNGEAMKHKLDYTL